jgi:hypothetical protein
VVLSLGIFSLLLWGAYFTLDSFLTAIPGAAAQEFDGNCSVVYVTVPGPIITVSLIGASPTNPARGTYYFSVINGTTEWLNSITPPSRFSTLVTQTPEITPIVSSLSATAPSSSGLLTVPPTGTAITSALPSSNPTIPESATTLTSLPMSGSTLVTSFSASIPGSSTSIPLPTSSVSLSSFSPPVYPISS